LRPRIFSCLGSAIRRRSSEDGKRVRIQDRIGSDSRREQETLGRNYSWAGICCSISRHALIFRRRQTQHNGSSAAIVVSAPQTEHFTVLVRRSGEMARRACSRISAGTTVSDFGCALRFIVLVPPLHYGRCPARKQANTRPKVYAASGICTTAATSSAEPHRGHFWPAATRGYFPRKSISAGTV